MEPTYKQLEADSDDTDSDDIESQKKNKHLSSIYNQGYRPLGGKRDNTLPDIAKVHGQGFKALDNVDSGTDDDRTVTDNSDMSD